MIQSYSDQTPFLFEEVAAMRKTVESFSFISLSILLATILCFITDTVAFADNASTPDDGLVPETSTDDLENAITAPYQDGLTWTACGTCEWIVDDTGTLVVRPADDAASGELRDWSIDSDARSPWAGLEIISVRFEGNVTTPTAIGMFEGCSSLAATDLSGLDTSSVTDMSSMFEGCSALVTVDLADLDTSSMVNATSMFSECSSLKTLDLSHIDMSSTVDMDLAFYKCSSLESIDLPRLDSQSLRGLSSTFRGCSSLKTLDLSGIDAPGLYDLNWTFADCPSLESIDFTSSHFSCMQSMDRTFYNCVSLQSLDLSTFDASKVTSMESTFENCYSLQTVNLSTFDASSVGTLRNMFANCYSLQSLDLSGFTGGLYTSSMFYFDCDESFHLTIGDNFNSYDVTVNDFAEFPGVRSGHYLDRIVTGKWTNTETGEVLDTRSIPSRVAATYAPEVIYRDLGASVEVSPDNCCPTYALIASVNFKNGSRDPELNLYFQWFDAGSNQPVSSISTNTTFQIPEGGIDKEYYCVVTDNLENSGNELRSSTISASHPFDEQWLFDETGHWHECSICSEPTEKSAHAFSDWKIIQRPFSDKPGEKVRSCTTCEYSEHEEVLAEPFENPFTDIIEDSTPHYEHILWLAEHEITTGFPDGTFRPYDSIARCDMAAFLQRLGEIMGAEDPGPFVLFFDVYDDTPHADAIRWISAAGISDGFIEADSTITFRPYANVARCDMAAFLHRLNNYVERWS